MQMILRDRRRLIILIILLLIAGLASAQDSARRARNAKRYTPRHVVWVTPTHAKSVNGIAIGIQAMHHEGEKFHVNGINVDAGIGGMIALPFAVLFGTTDIDPGEQAFELFTDSATNIINGISISVGGEVYAGISGINISGIITQGAYVNGISVTGIMSATRYFKGITVSGIYNAAHKGVGLQIGLINKCKYLKGLQIGLWNINGKRNLPIINWGF